MKYNTKLKPLIIPEYGRHIHSMVDSLLEMKDDKKRNEQAKVLINIMGNLNSHLRDVEEYKHKLWDHLLIMSKNQLQIDFPHSKSKTKEIETEVRIKNTQGSVKHKHYGKLIVMLIKESVQIKDLDLRNKVFYQIAQQMKRSFLNWNQTNVQDIQIWEDLEQLAGCTLNLDRTTVIPVFQIHTSRKKNYHKKTNRKYYSKK